MLADLPCIPLTVLIPTALQTILTKFLVYIHFWLIRGLTRTPFLAAIVLKVCER